MEITAKGVFSHHVDDTVPSVELSCENVKMKQHHGIQKALQVEENKTNLVVVQNDINYFKK